MYIRRILVFLVCVQSLQPSLCQVGSAHLSQFLQTGQMAKLSDILYKKEVTEYYRNNNYNFSWLGIANERPKNDLLKLLNNVTSLGLKDMDYSTSFLASLSLQPGTMTTDDSLITELRYTDAGIRLFRALVYGNTAPSFRYDGLDYTPSCFDIPKLLAEYTSKGNLQALDQLQSGMPEIGLVRNKILQLEKLQVPGIEDEEKILSSKANHTNKPLLKKLYHLGLSDSLEIVSDKKILESVKEAQRLFGLLADGTLRSSIIGELNVPVAIRIKQLYLGLNYYRWLHCLTQNGPAIVVNIPAAYMKVYDRQGVILEMRMVLGKPSTPTPTLCSRISDVILYPYWMVPRNIATKELLPSIKRDPGFVDANGFQLITTQGKIVNPYKVDWPSVTASNFPYIIRQSTGCDNALGLIKLDFYNPFSVYLHDTPHKSLFTLNKRYFSHGCMRMEKPMELGHLVLTNNAVAIDTLTEKGCIYNQSPMVVKADQKMPVVVWYNPVGTDSTGRVIFYEDIYNKRMGRD